MPRTGEMQFIAHFEPYFDLPRQTILLSPDR